MCRRWNRYLHIPKTGAQSLSAVAASAVICLFVPVVVLAVTQFVIQLSKAYRKSIREHHIRQSMNSAGGRCHDNARCVSMWARMKTELLYDRYITEQMTVEELKVLIWRYFLSYWNNRRICSANGGLPPMIKRGFGTGSIVSDILEKNVSTNIDNINSRNTDL